MLRLLLLLLPVLAFGQPFVHSVGPDEHFYDGAPLGEGLRALHEQGRITDAQRTRLLAQFMETSPVPRSLRYNRQTQQLEFSTQPAAAHWDRGVPAQKTTLQYIETNLPDLPQLHRAPIEVLLAIRPSAILRSFVEKERIQSVVLRSDHKLTLSPVPPSRVWPLPEQPLPVRYRQVSFRGNLPTIAAHERLISVYTVLSSVHGETGGQYSSDTLLKAEYETLAVIENPLFAEQQQQRITDVAIQKELFLQRYKVALENE